MPDQSADKNLVAGGAATAAGMDFQNRVAAWFAARVLAEKHATPLWDWATTSTLEFIRCETEQPVDDIMVGDSEGRIAIGQVKHSLGLEKGENSPFGKTIGQFVRQYLRPNQAATQKPLPWDKALDPTRDRYLLIVGRGSSNNITSTLPTLLSKIRALPKGVPISAGQFNQDEKEVCSTVQAHIEKSLQKASAAALGDQQVRDLLTFIQVSEIDVDSGGSAEREAKELLRQSILLQPDQADGAWDVLVQACAAFARDRGGANRSQLQQIITKAGIYIKAPPSYRADIQRLLNYSSGTVQSLAGLAEIGVGQRTPIKIRRPSTEVLEATAKTKSLLVIGDPGAGKSGALHDLALSLQTAGSDVLLLAADRIQSSSLAALRTELQLEHDLADVVENWHGTGHAFLITDALDAARSDHAGKMLRELLSRTLQQGGRWRVVASVRKFDLRYNQDLRAMFPGSPPPDYGDPTFANISHFLVPVLNSDELRDVGAQSEAMKRLLEAVQASPNSELRELIRVPFNLRLMGELVGEGATVDALTVIKTQIELLNRYWEARVIRQDGHGDAREAVLRKAAAKMVESRSLRVLRSDIWQERDTNGTLNDLLSNKLLEEYQPFSCGTVDRYTLKFPHHVLFDYAAARLVFRLEVPDLVRKVSSDPELVVAFRPSFVLHFQHLWDLDPVGREPFWELATHFESDGRIPLVGKIIGSTLAIDLFQKISDFDFLIQRLKHELSTPSQRSSVNIVGHITGGLIARATHDRPLVGDHAPPWCDFAERLAPFVTVAPFALSQLLTLLCQQPNQLTPGQRKAASVAARALLEYSWADSTKFHLGLVSGGIQAVSRTFSGDPTSAAALLRKGLEPEHMRRHGHQEVFFFAQEIENLAANDADLVMDIYLAAYRHLQTSEETTSLGNSQILRLTSTVGQDWQHNLYMLAKVYPKFLTIAPLQATGALIGAIAAWVVREHASASRNIVEDKIQFCGVSGTLRTDYSSIWDSGADRAGEFALEMAGHWQTFLQKLAASDGHRLDQILRLVAEQNGQAVLWRRLLQSGVASPLTLGIRLRELLWQAPILTSIDTSEPAGQLLKVIFASLSPEHQISIEKVILAIPPDTDARGKSNFRQRDRLLGCLPNEAIVTPEARALRDEIEAKGGPPPNEPFFQMGPVQVQEYTEIEHLKQWGVPVDEPANRQMLEMFTPLRNFCSSHINTVPTAEETTKILPQLETALAKFRTAEKDGVHPRERALTWGSIVQTCACIAHRNPLPTEEPKIEVVRDLLLEAAAECPNDTIPTTSDSFDDSPSWGSPTPLVDAAEGLLLIARDDHWRSDDVTAALRRLACAEDPAVRLQIARNLNVLLIAAPEVMWSLFEIFAQKDPSRAVVAAAVNSASRIASREPTRVVALAEVVFDRVVDGHGVRAVREACVTIFLGLHLWQANRACEDRLHSIADAPWLHALEARRIVMELRDALAVGRADVPEPEKEAVRKRALSLTNRILTVAAVEFGRLVAENRAKSSSELDPKVLESIRILHGLLDSLSTQIYFASGAYELKQSPPKTALDKLQRERFLREASTLFDALATVGIPQVACHLAETLESLLEFNPAEVFLKVRETVRQARSGGFEYESLAAEVVVRIVQRFLAEYRVQLRENIECRKALVEILNIFVEAGWPAARQLTYRLEEIFR